MLVYLDIDGVLADCEHRLHYLKEKNYEKFYSDQEIDNDRPIDKGFELLEMLMDTWEVELYLITGRPYRAEEITRKWLRERRSDYGDLTIIMRKDHDYRPSDILKPEIMKKNVEWANGREEPIYFIDDDPKNVKAVEEACPEVTGFVFGSSRL